VSDLKPLYEKLSPILRDQARYEYTDELAGAIIDAIAPEIEAPLRAQIAELEAAIEPFRRVKAITSIYEYVPIEALRDDEQFNFKMNGAEMKTIYALLNGKG
jgi:hypothetical protein